MAIGNLITEADLARFITRQIEQPSRLTTGPIDGARIYPDTLDLTGRVAEADLAAPNTWLRLASAANRKVNFGVVTITGTGTPTATASVTHGLGVTPVAALVTANATAGTLTVGSLIATTISLGATTFTARIRDYLGTNFSDDHDVYWVAIG